MLPIATITTTTIARTIGLIAFTFVCIRVGTRPRQDVDDTLAMASDEMVEQTHSLCYNEQTRPPPQRSLVLMVHSGKTGKDYAQEWSNLHYFMRHGVNISLADYIFIIPDPAVEAWPEHFVNVTSPNNGKLVIRFISLGHAVPCDLCAHAIVLRTIVGLDSITREYSTVVTMNSGVRGPFPARSGGNWLAYMRRNTFERTPRMAVGLTISWEVRCHIQSYFLAIPSCVAPAIADLWWKTCAVKNMWDCTVVGELTDLRFLNSLGVSVYSTSQNITISSLGDAVAHTPSKASWWTRDYPNPNFLPINSTMAIFIKFGGGVYRGGWIPPSVFRDMQRRAYN
jgi:hypothetical protein